MTQEQKNAKQREYRKNNKNSCSLKYEKTINGFLVRLYRNMVSRVNGIQKAKYHLYKGKYLLPRQDFYDWAKSSPDFYKLFNDWVASGYSRKLTPSVDRVNSLEGYYLSNMEWVTHSENSRRSSIIKYKIAA